MSLSVTNMLGGGKPEGLYAWKKYDIIKKYNINSVTYSTISNPIDVTDLCVERDGKFYLPFFSSSSYTVNSEGYFEFSSIQKKAYLTIPSDGSTVSAKPMRSYMYLCLQSANFPDNETDLIMSPTADEIFSVNNTDSYTYAKYDSSTNKVILYEQHASNYFTGLTTEAYYEPNSFLDYIVSDKENAYPDGAEQDGYYYEKVVGVAELFGCTKVDIKTYTPTSNTVVSTGTAEFPTNFTPKYVLILDGDSTKEPPSFDYCLKNILIKIGVDTNYPNWGYGGGYGRAMGSASASPCGFSIRASKSNNKFIVSSFYNDSGSDVVSSAYYLSGVTYTFIFLG